MMNGIRGQINIPISKPRAIHQYLETMVAGRDWNGPCPDDDHRRVWKQLHDAEPLNLFTGAEYYHGRLTFDQEHTNQSVFIKFLTWIWWHTYTWNIVLFDNRFAPTMTSECKVEKTDLGFIWANGQELRCMTAIQAMGKAVGDG